MKRLQRRTTRNADVNGRRSLLKPLLPTIKTLFALSGNTCAYTGCEQVLASPGWHGVKADIAHIEGEKPGAARYNPEMSDEQRRDYPNLMVVCPNHHRLIDLLDPEGHPVELLREMKEQHESSSIDGMNWATDEQLTRYALACVAVTVEYLPLQNEHAVTRGANEEAKADDSASRGGVVTRRANEEAKADDRAHVRGGPILELTESDDGSLEVKNTSNADAFAVSVTVDGSPNGVELAIVPPPRLRPGEVWRAGWRRRVPDDSGQLEAVVRWANSDGAHFDSRLHLR